VDIKSTQDDVKADLFKWCDTIESKLNSLGIKQNKILKAAAKVIESQMGKVTVATDKITNNMTLYH
jgi:translation initiation factor 2B subunit (eIF-2B alpha/beta/delta family)